MTDADYMRLALELAERGLETVRPNPMVGAVAVREGRIVGQGYHPGPGQPHAEVFALSSVGESARGVTLYVTLEPCCFAGRTPACTELIIQKRVSRVVCAMEDPDARVSGRGVARLGEAGIRVEVGLLAEQARRLNEVYTKHRTCGLPFVTLKLAQTLDGRIASSSGDSRWITSKASRAYAHRLRARVDAVLVGAGTVRADDPELSVRHVAGRDPVKIVLDSGLRICTRAKVFAGAPLVVAAAEGVLRERQKAVAAAGARVWQVPAVQGRPRIRDVLARAAAENLIHVLVEGGGQVAASALREGLVDRMAVFIAPKIMGGGIPAVGDLGIDRVVEAVELEEVEVERIGADLFCTARVRRQ